MCILHEWTLSNLKTGELGGHHYAMFGDSYMWTRFIIFLSSFNARSRACSLKPGHDVLQPVSRREPQVGISCGKEVINCTSFSTWSLILSLVTYRNGVSSILLFYLGNLTFSQQWLWSVLSTIILVSDVSDENAVLKMKANSSCKMQITSWHTTGFAALETGIFVTL
jgi:hypothetical protein